MRHLIGSAIILTALVSGCSTTEVVEPLPKLPEVPNYAHVAHPQGYDLTDIRLMFYSKMAPKPEDMVGCTDEMMKLRTMTTSIDEIATGARELVLKDPVKYHWCFYAKMLEVYDALKSTNTYWSEKQKKVMEVYLTLVPIARAFKLEYGDVRYLRVANRQYKQMSEWVFYRKVDLTPEGTEEMMEDVANPFSLWKKPELASESVLEKYGISRTEPSPMGLAMPEDRTPASQAVVTSPTAIAPVATAPTAEVEPELPKAGVPTLNEAPAVLPGRSRAKRPEPEAKGMSRVSQAKIFRIYEGKLTRKGPLNFLSSASTTSENCGHSTAKDSFSAARSPTFSMRRSVYQYQPAFHR